MPNEIEPYMVEPSGIEIQAGTFKPTKLEGQNLIEKCKALSEKIKADPRTRQYQRGDGQSVYIRDQEDGSIDVITSKSIEFIPPGSSDKLHIYLRRFQLAAQRLFWKQVKNEKISSK